jgi:hypothetical protein
MDPVRIKARIIPTTGHLPNVKRDALEAQKVLKFGGVIIVRKAVGCSRLSVSAEETDRAFAAKQRKSGHTLDIMGTYL